MRSYPAWAGGENIVYICQVISIKFPRIFHDVLHFARIFCDVLHFARVFHDVLHIVRIFHDVLHFPRILKTSDLTPNFCLTLCYRKKSANGCTCIEGLNSHHLSWYQPRFYGLYVKCVFAVCRAALIPTQTWNCQYAFTCTTIPNNNKHPSLWANSSEWSSYQGQKTRFIRTTHAIGFLNFVKWEILVFEPKVVKMNFCSFVNARLFKTP